MQFSEKYSFGDATLKINNFPQFNKTHYWTITTPLKSRKPARWQGLKLFNDASGSALFSDL